MGSLVSLLVSGLSKAALGIIARLLTAELFERVLIKLIKDGVTLLASKTENKTDDEIAKIIVDRLGSDK